MCLLALLSVTNKGEIMGDVIYIVVFVVLFTVIHKVLKEHPLFGKGSIIISVCASLLCMAGMQRMFAQGKGNEGSFDVILLPYAALGVSILFVLLLMLIGKLRKKGERQREERRTAREAGHERRSGSDTATKNEVGEDRRRCER